MTDKAPEDSLLFSYERGRFVMDVHDLGDGRVELSIGVCDLVLAPHEAKRLADALTSHFAKSREGQKP